FLHHRHTSPFGFGWGVSEVERLYPDPSADRAVLVRGTGEEEYFLLRPSWRLVAFGSGAVSRVFARDTDSNEIFGAFSTGEIVRVARDGTTTPLFAGLPITTDVQAMAIARVAGERRFVVAQAAGLIEVIPNVGVRTLFTRTGIDNNNLFTRSN